MNNGEKKTVTLKKVLLTADMQEGTVLKDILETQEVFQPL